MKITTLALALLWMSSEAGATQLTCDPIPRQGKHPAAGTINRFTNYEPGRGGINGRCGRSSTAGIDPCKFFLEDHVSGSKPGVVVAVAQRGGSSGLFGAAYRLVPLENKGIQPQAGCVIAIAADHYGRGSNGMKKMDVVTKNHSKLANKVNSARGEVQLLGPIEEFRAGKKRKIERKPGSKG